MEKEGKKKKKTPWYFRWWAILIYIFIIFNIFSAITIPKDNFLKEQNYEVLSYNYNNYDNNAYLEMKPLGDREKQVTSGLIFLRSQYKEEPLLDEYIVIIHTEKDSCYYMFNSKIINAYFGGFSDGVTLEKSEVEDDLQYLLWKYFLISEVKKMKYQNYTYPEDYSYPYTIYDEYMKLNDTTFDTTTLLKMVTYTIESKECE